MSKLVISKANHLIETSYRLGKREQYFILYLISKIDSVNDKNFSSYEMSFEEIKKVINYDGVKRVGNSKELFQIMNNLNKIPIKWETEDEIGQVVWLSGMKYNKIKETFTFTFPEDLREFLLELSSRFTQYDLENVKHFKKSHTIRMYEIIKRQQESKPYKKFRIEVDQLKFYLGISGKYNNFHEFKRGILETSKKEINQHTDINIDYEPSRKKRKKVEELEFTITTKSNIPATTKKEATDDLLKELVGWGVTSELLTKWRKKYGDAYIIERVTYTKKQPDIANRGGYLNSIMDKEIKKEESMSFEEQLKKTRGILYSNPQLEPRIRAKYGDNIGDKALVRIIKQMYPEKFEKD